MPVAGPGICHRFAATLSIIRQRRDLRTPGGLRTSVAIKTLSTSGTLAYMGYHTVALPAPIAVTNGQSFVVAVKITSPGTIYPIATEYPVANYSSSATAAAGQTYVRSSGSSWTDIITTRTGLGSGNVCLKAFTVTSGVVIPNVTTVAPTGTGSYAVGNTLTVNRTSDQALSTGEFCAYGCVPAQAVGTAAS